MNIKSMTGFGVARDSLAVAALRGGSAQSSEGRSLEVEVEIRSVNSRFLEVNVRVPQGWGAMEQELQGFIKKSLKRGRVDVSVRKLSGGGQSCGVSYNEPLFLKFVEIYRQAIADVAGQLGEGAGERVACEVLRKREVLDLVLDEDAAVDSEFVIGVAKVALAGLIEMRTSEGKALEEHLETLLAEFTEWKERIAVYASQVTELVRGRLMERLAKLEAQSVSLGVTSGVTLAGLVTGGACGVLSGEERVAQEVVLIAERADITEELVRLDSHITKFAQFLKEGTGKKMEFLLQEMGREVNTIGSKGQMREVSQAVVEAKSVLEKMREQLANCE